MSSPIMPSVVFKGIELNVNWKPGNGVRVAELPTCPGIYAEIHWPERGVRIGETGRSIRAKIQHDIRWFNNMQNKTVPPEQFRRTIPIAQTAKRHGAGGFEFYVVSATPELNEKILRQECERYMFS